MSGWAEEYASTQAMMTEAYRKLQHANPNHPLLKLITFAPSHEDWTESKGFLRRCIGKNWRNVEHPRIHAYTNYLLAMEDAVQGLPFKLPPPPANGVGAEKGLTEFLE